MPERMVRANGLELWTEDFGDPADPPVLLIMGASASGILWEEELCEALAARGRYVIRYDNRDTGRSTSSVDFAAGPYTLPDMARDAVGVLDGCGIASAHVVGTSTGGGITQYLALDHRARVRTITCLFTSPALSEISRSIGGEDVGGDLEMPSAEAVIEAALELLENPPQTRDEHVEARLRTFEVLCGSRYPLPRERWRALLAREYDRAIAWDAQYNHSPAQIASPPDLRPRLRGLDVPALVIHGTEDPLTPYAHGVALAEAIPGARLVSIEGYGHQFHPDVYPLWVEEIAAHTATGNDDG